MTMQNNIYKFLYVVLSLPMAMTLQAQEVGKYRFDDATQLWRLTNNAAGLGIDTTRNRGYAQIGYEHHSGDYHRVQEGSRTNQLHFYTERYQKVGKYLYGYGKFDFDYGRTSERSWSDVRRSYNSSPYIYGSDIKGMYDFQDFDFTAALASVTFKKHWNVGLKLDYQVGDLSRLRDPRPQNLLLEYKFSPAVTYSFGKSSFGLSANYHRRKEQIKNITVKQEGDTKTYYEMIGMEHANSIVSGYSSGYPRQWVDHRFGGELSYAYRSKNYNLLVAAHLERGSEKHTGQYEKMYGKLVDYRYGISIMNRLHCGRLLHEADIKVFYDQAYDDEYHQKEVKENIKISPDRTITYSYHNADGTLETRDSVISGQSSSQTYFETQMILRKRYQFNVFNLDVHYRLNFIDNSSINGYAGFRFAMQDSRNKYLLPTSSRRYNSFDTTLEGGIAVLKGRLWIDGAMTYRGVGKADLNLADPTTDYAVNVLIPDMEYYNAKFIKGSLAVTYNFPIKIKRKNTSWYVKANGDWLRTNSNLHASSFGVTLGMFN